MFHSQYKTTYTIIDYCAHSLTHVANWTNNYQFRGALRMYSKRPQLWIGPECTLNRVRDRFADQFERSGHALRLDDLELFAGLGAKAVRYPLLWEKVSPDSPEQCDWSWTDPRMARLRDLDLEVIAGLVHHGSGPAYTNLLDDEGFALGLARHARNVAERYPWVRRWTPVNEPLTTARFSALYGHWHPHADDELSFWRALLNQIDGVRLSMAAVREINPEAELIQTDDLGRTYCTAAMRQQAGYDNTRRWAGWDLLCGRVVPGHPLWQHLEALGLAGRLESIAAAPCPPDVIGVNHYLTSDRFLDHRVQRYPPHVHGGNGRQRYADVEALRVMIPPPLGLEGVLREAWDRYRIPLAITEVHNGCTREEQLRWTAQAWDTACSLVGEGVPVQSVTIWSLLGSCDWNTLLTAPGTYESGAFDVSSGIPRPTALAKLARGLPENEPRHLAAHGAGWWQRSMRLMHPATSRPAPLRAHRSVSDLLPDTQPLLILGATGTLGQALARACAHRNLSHVLTGRGEINLDDAGSIARALDRHQPWAVINAAGWVRVDDAEHEPEACLAANAAGAIRLAEAAALRSVPTLNFSSDLVFDGELGRAYVESDSVAPLSVYGKSKVAMERGLAMLSGSHLVVRTAAFFSPFDVHNFAVAAVVSAREHVPFAAASDLTISPTYVPHLVNACLDLLIDGERGIWHLTNGCALSWAEFAVQVCEARGLSQARVESTPAARLAFTAPRPRSVPLASERGAIMPPMQEALAQFARDYVSSRSLLSC
jgi:dTDP-4-dehydrorhamnose reductase